MVQAPHGEKTIAVTVRFWTNDIAQDAGMVEPGHCWASGTVYVKQNASHNIGPGEDWVFNSIDDLPNVIGQALAAQGVTVRDD